MWLSGYQFRVEIPVEERSSNQLNNYQMSVQIYSDVGTNSIGSIYCNNNSIEFPNDLRFTTSDGITEIDYWIEDVTVDPIMVWLEIPVISMLENITYYMYYGKSVPSSTSHGSNTFLVYDDFISDTHSLWSDTYSKYIWGSDMPLNAITRHSTNPIVGMGSAECPQQVGQAGGQESLIRDNDGIWHLFYTSGIVNYNVYHITSACSPTGAWKLDGLSIDCATWNREGYGHGGFSILRKADDFHPITFSEVDLGIGDTEDQRYWMVWAEASSMNIASNTSLYGLWSSNNKRSPILEHGVSSAGTSGWYDSAKVGPDGIVFISGENGFWIIYEAQSTIYDQTHPRTGMLASSNNLQNWFKCSGLNPILVGESESDDYITINPQSIYKSGGEYYLLYTGIGVAENEQLCGAKSTDLKIWTKDTFNPLLVGKDSQWDGGAVTEQSISDFCFYRDSTNAYKDLILYEGGDSVYLGVGLASLNDIYNITGLAYMKGNEVLDYDNWGLVKNVGTQSYAIRSSLKTTEDATYNGYAGITAGYRDSGHFAALYLYPEGGPSALFLRQRSGATINDISNKVMAFSYNTLYTIELRRWSGSDNTRFSTSAWYSPSGLIMNPSSTLENNAHDLNAPASAGLFHGNYISYFDWVFVRNYAYPDPQWANPGTEEIYICPIISLSGSGHIFMYGGSNRLRFITMS